MKLNVLQKQCGGIFYDNRAGYDGDGWYIACVNNIVVPVRLELRDFGLCNVLNTEIFNGQIIGRVIAFGIKPPRTNVYNNI